jgi:hypothetical protein
MTVSRSLSLHSRVEGRQLQMAKAAEEMSLGPAVSEKKEQNAGQVWIRGKALETWDEIRFLKQAGENKK